MSGGTNFLLQTFTDLPCAGAERYGYQNGGVSALGKGLPGTRAVKASVMAPLEVVCPAGSNASYGFDLKRHPKAMC